MVWLDRDDIDVDIYAIIFLSFSSLLCHYILLPSLIEYFHIDEFSYTHTYHDVPPPLFFLFALMMIDIMIFLFIFFSLFFSLYIFFSRWYSRHNILYAMTHIYIYCCLSPLIRFHWAPPQPPDIIASIRRHISFFLRHYAIDTPFPPSFFLLSAMPYVSSYFLYFHAIIIFAARFSRCAMPWWWWRELLFVIFNHYSFSCRRCRCHSFSIFAAMILFFDIYWFADYFDITHIDICRLLHRIWTFSSHFYYYLVFTMSTLYSDDFFSFFLSFRDITTTPPRYFHHYCHAILHHYHYRFIWWHIHYSLSSYCLRFSFLSSFYITYSFRHYIIILFIE